MKNKLLSFVLAFCMLVSIAYAANEVVINESKISFYAYGEGLTNIQSVNITNTATNAYNVTLSGTLTFASDSDIKIYFTNQTISLNPQESKIVEIKISDTDLSKAESGRYTGSLNVVNKADGTIISSVPAEIIVPGLKLVKLTSNDNTVERGQKINLTIEYKNTGKVGYLDDLTLVELKIIDRKGNILENEDGDELESTDQDLARLKYGSSDKYTEEFTLPFDLSGSSLTVIAKIKGCNEGYSSECFEAELNRSLTIDIPADKVGITRASFSPSVLECDENRAKINIEIKNLGTRYEYVRYILRNSNTLSEKMLNSGEETRLDNKFDSTDGYSLTHEEFVDLADLKTGQNIYTLVVDYGTKTPATMPITITKLACTTTTTPTTPTVTEPVVVVTPTTPTTPITTNPTTVTLKDVSGFSLGSDWIVPSIIGGIGLLFGIVIAMLVVPRR